VALTFCGAGHAFPAAAVLPVCGTHCVSHSTAVVGPVLNATIACQEITSDIFNTVSHILSENFYQNFVLISKNPSFSRHQKRKHYIITVIRWLIEYCHIENFSFPVLILEYLSLKNYLVNFVQNCKIYSKEMLVNDIIGITNSDKYSRRYDLCFFGTRGILVRNGKKSAFCAFNIFGWISGKNRPVKKILLQHSTGFSRELEFLHGHVDD